MVFGGLLKNSFIDYPGKISSVLFLAGCNFRCPYCHNPDLALGRPEQHDFLHEEKVFTFLESRIGLIEGIVITGGEPTLCPDLLRICEQIRGLGYPVKLDTNGSRPGVVKKLIDSTLVDYIAMDIKSSLDFDNYSKSAGIKDKMMLEKVKDSIEIIMNSKIDYEFRTTIVPLLHSEETIMEIARYISGAKKYVLQNFSPLEKTLDPSFQKIKPYPDEKIQELSEKAKKYVSNCCWR